MTTISVVMVAAFGFIYFITYMNIQTENERKLESVPRLAANPTGDTFMHRRQFTNSDEEMFIVRVPMDFSPSFTILVDRNGQMMDVLTHLDMPQDVYDEIATRVWKKQKEQGTINFENRKWQYKITAFEGGRIGLTNRQIPANFENVQYQIRFLDITDSSKTLTQLFVTFVIVGFIMLFILFGISYYFANRSIRPIEENWEKQKQFITDASHELKTPLAIISANTDALLANREETVASQDKWIDYIQKETRRMGKLLNDMLYLAKVENTGEESLPFDLSNTVKDVIASMEAVMFEKGIHLTHSIASEIIVTGEAEKIKQAVLIFLDNAVKYTSVHGKVDIVLKKHRNNAVFLIQNTGIGIPDEKLPRIFDRFYRSDPSRSKETGGYGLGLAIAKTIIERSGGTIYAESNESRTVFTFELKLK